MGFLCSTVEHSHFCDLSNADHGNMADCTRTLGQCWFLYLLNTFHKGGRGGPFIAQ